MCAKFHGFSTYSCRLGGFDFVMIGISSKFHLSFLQFKFCFSTSMFQIECLCLLMTGANRFDEDVFLQCSRQAHRDIFEMLEDSYAGRIRRLAHA